MVGVVIGSYQLLRKLGEGGMGAVYLGQHMLLGRRAAIKVLLPALSARPDIVSRFFNEARAVTSINDAGIVQIFDFGYHTDGSAFIVMEYLDGEPLDRRLARLGRLPVDQALHVCRQLATSLAAAHAQHIVHRDLKPENIFLVRDAEVASGERSKILDFGIAKLSDDHTGQFKTSTGMLMGTPSYMSPEQCRGVDIDHRTDIYALGCVLFQLITGRPPFQGEGTGDVISAHIREPVPAPSACAADLPRTFDPVVMRCLAKAPAERFQTMAELAAALGQLLPHVAPSAATPARVDAAAPPLMSAPATTLGASVGQYAPSRPTAPPRKRRVGMVAGLTVATGVVIAIVATQLAAPAHDPPPSLAAAPPAAPTITAPPPPPPRPSAPAPAPTVDAVSSVAAPTAPVAIAPTPPPVVDRHKAASRTGKATQPATTTPASSPPHGVTGCGVASFAAIYNADAPSHDAVRASLASLRACHDAGAISDAKYEQIQSALVTRL